MCINISYLLPLMVVRQVVCWLPWRPAVHPEKATNTRQTKTRSSRMAQWSEGHRATVEDQKRNIPGSSWSGTFCSISDGIGRTTFTLDSVFVCSNDQWFLMKWWNNFFSFDVEGMFIERKLIRGITWYTLHELEILVLVFDVVACACVGGVPYILR